MKIILLIFQQHFHQLWLFQRIRRRINEKENKKRKKEEVSTQWTLLNLTQSEINKVSAKGFEKERFVVVEYYYYTLLS